MSLQADTGHDEAERETGVRAVRVQGETVAAGEGESVTVLHGWYCLAHRRYGPQCGQCVAETWREIFGDWR